LKIGQKPSGRRDGIDTKRRIDEDTNAGVAAAAHAAVINDFPAVKKCKKQKRNYKGNIGNGTK
jgi:hypothetical protein